jgi:DNA-binding NarL/FixJ family response regulator
LQPAAEGAGEAENGSQAIELARSRNPDVIVMDVSMPVMNGIEATRIVSRDFPWIKVVALSMHGEKDVIDAMRAAGAVAYLTKVRASNDLAATIRSTRNGSLTAVSALRRRPRIRRRLPPAA